MKKILALCLSLLMLTQASALAQSESVVALHGSLAEAWLLAGGTLKGTTEDAISERKLALEDGVSIIGTTKTPNMELILELEPDLVVYSTEIQGQVEAAAQLEGMGVRCEGFNINRWQEYLRMIRVFCDDTGRDDLYQQQVDEVQKPIEEYMAKAQADERYNQRTVLLLRAYSTGVKAKNSDNLAGAMLRDMGLVNIADAEGSLMENLTMEAMIEADPDYIFVVCMGTDQEQAMQALEESLTGNPAWETLSAVKEGHFITLDRELFHLKPNARWAESYGYLWELLYEEPDAQNNRQVEVRNKCPWVPFADDQP